MSLFDDGQFCALDGEIFNQNMPGDVHIDFGIDHNLNVLEAQHCEAVSVPHQCCSAAPTEYIGDRAYASTEWLCVHVAPFVVHPTLESLKLYIPCRVSCETPAPDRLRAPAVGVLVELNGVAIKEFTITERPIFDAVELVLPVDAPPVRTTTIMRIWVRSVRTGQHQIYSETSNELSRLRYRGPSMPEFLQINPGVSQQVGLFENETPPGPNTRDWSVQAIGSTRVPPVDVLVHADSSFDANNGAVILKEYGEDEASIRYDLSYLQHRGFYVEGTHKTLGFDDRVMRAGIPSRADIAATHLVRTRKLIDRERPVCLGWQGTRDSNNEQWSAQKRGTRWSTAPFRAPFTDMMRIPLSVVDAKPLVDLYLMAVAYVPVSDFALAPSDEPLNTLQSFGARGTGRLTVRLGQFSDGSLGTVDQYDLNIPMFVYPTDRTGHWPLLTQLMWRETSAPGQQAYTLKEGCLYEQDFDLVHFARASFDASSVDELESTRPLAIEITTKGFVLGDQSGDAFLGFDESDVHIAIVGVSAYTAQLVLNNTPP